MLYQVQCVDDSWSMAEVLLLVNADDEEEAEIVADKFIAEYVHSSESSDWQEWGTHVQNVPVVENYVLSTEGNKTGVYFWYRYWTG